MFSDLFQIDQTGSDSLNGSAHSTKGSDFQLFASIKRVRKLNQLEIIAADLLNNVPNDVHLGQGYLIMILVVKDVQHI
jgi:hypothetical protein